MLQHFTEVVLDGPAAFFPGFTFGSPMGAMIMRESDGVVLYLFFVIWRSGSPWCTVQFAGLGPSSSGANCLVAHLFEAKFDVSDVDFTLYHCFYDEAMAFDAACWGRRRRLLALPSRGRRRLATTTGSSSGVGTRSVVVCRRINGRTYCTTI